LSSSVSLRVRRRRGSAFSAARGPPRRLTPPGPGERLQGALVVLPAPSGEVGFRATGAVPLDILPLQQRYLRAPISPFRLTDSSVVIVSRCLGREGSSTLSVHLALGDRTEDMASFWEDSRPHFALESLEGLHNVRP